MYFSSVAFRLKKVSAKQGRIEALKGFLVPLETQRQWSNAAVARTTPALLGLISLIVLRARELHAEGRLLHRRAAWYRKEEPTFSDALAAVRRSLWAGAARFPTSRRAGDRVEVPRAVLERLTDLACNAV